MPRAGGGLALYLAGTFLLMCGCTHRPVPQPTLSPAPTPSELAFVASALADRSAGPFFPPERLEEAVALVRWIRVHHSETRIVGAASPLSLEFRVPDSLFARLFRTGQPQAADSFVNRWLTPPRTGLPAFDSITEAMGGATAIQVEGVPRLISGVTVYYRQPVNIPGVARAYASLRPVIEVSPFQDIHVGSGGGVRIEVGDSVWTIDMSKGWGDCPVGCTNWHVWRFRYHRPTGVIEAVIDSGPPVP